MGGLLEGRDQDINSLVRIGDLRDFGVGYKEFRICRRFR